MNLSPRQRVALATFTARTIRPALMAAPRSEGAPPIRLSDVIAAIRLTSDRATLILPGSGKVSPPSP